MRSKIFLLIIACLFIVGALIFGFENAFKPSPGPVLVQVASTTGLANPASVNCGKKGGQLIIKQRSDGGQYGICVFEDNRQCEEWTLLHGECQPGDFKITGYENEAQVYCAITAGRVSMADKTCAFKDGMICDLDKYFSGQCLKTGLSELIKVSEPIVQTKVTSPLTIKGEARGSWFFEASFPIKLLNSKGKVIAKGIAQAKSDWMTNDFVPFEAELKFSAPKTIDPSLSLPLVRGGEIKETEGSLILSKDNPSGLPANDNQIIIPVIF